jgi:predicted acyltransferase
MTTTNGQAIVFLLDFGVLRDIKASMRTKEDVGLSDTTRGGGLQEERLVSLDVYRGLTVAGMILVTDPGTYSAVYWPLRHAEWNGATPTDMIFPSFLFIVGVVIPFSFAKRIERGADRARLAGHVVLRSALLFVIGLIVNGFPDYDLHTLRIPGILQRIALCHLCGGLIYQWSRGNVRTRALGSAGNWIIAGLTIFILAAYWLVLKLVPVPGFGAGRLDSLGNLPAYIDRSILGTSHMWAYGLTPGHGVTYDPEGLISTLPAVATLLVGVLAGAWMRTKRSERQKAIGLAAAGLILLLVGWLLHPLLPINKRIWTSTFALFSSGVSLLAFSFCYAILDIKRWRRWASPALIFGTNAIFAFALSSVITTLSDRIHVRDGSGAALSLHRWGYQYGFASWLEPVHASLAYAVAIVLLNMAIVGLLYRRQIFLRV